MRTAEIYVYELGESEFGFTVQTEHLALESREHVSYSSPEAARRAAVHAVKTIGAYALIKAQSEAMPFEP